MHRNPLPPKHTIALVGWADRQGKQGLEDVWTGEGLFADLDEFCTWPSSRTSLAWSIVRGSVANSLFVLKEKKQMGRICEI